MGRAHVCASRRTETFTVQCGTMRKYNFELQIYYIVKLRIIFNPIKKSFFKTSRHLHTFFLLPHNLSQRNNFTIKEVIKKDRKFIEKDSATIPLCVI